MVESEFCLNQIFFEEVIVNNKLLKNLIDIHKHINKFKNSKIFYSPFSSEFIKIMSKSPEDRDKNERVFYKLFLKEISNILKEDTKNSDMIEYCLLEKDTCLVSITTNSDWHTTIYKSEEFQLETNNIFDMNSFNEYYKIEKIVYFFESLFKNKSTKTIGLLDSLYPNVNNIEFSSKFNEDYNNIENSEVKEKIIRIFASLFIGEKGFESYDFHSESSSVKQDRKLKEYRKVEFDSEVRYIYMHLKVTKDWSIYAEIDNDTLYLGQITSHLPTVKY